MDDPESPDLPTSWGPVPIAVYVAMLGATLAGQAAGVVVDALALHDRSPWVPLALSVGLEALAGARFAAARLGRPLRPSECARVSVYYSALLAAIGVPLGLWTIAAAPRGSGLAVSPARVALVVALLLGALVVATGLRLLLMQALSRRRP